MKELSALIDAFNRGERQALAKIITLIESDVPLDKSLRAQALGALKKPKASLRLAISGPPGVGKSTFINILGKKLAQLGYKIAIVPIDPASVIHGGSVLADKTRMGELLNNPDIYIRPCSSRGVLGGVNLALSDVIFVLESFAYDFIIIETVGVGQSEMLAFTLADYFVLLCQPGSGDALQALKKGILERADFILVNKADGDLRAQALQSLNFLDQEAAYKAMISARDDKGIDEFLAALLKKHEQKKSINNNIFLERQKRLEGFFDFALQERLWRELFKKKYIKKERQHILEQVSKSEEALGPLLDKLADELLKNLA